MLQRLPARVAPAAQSSEVNGVIGVGSTHCQLVGPLHSLHAALHGLQTPLPSGQVPGEHALVQVEPSSIASTPGGQLDLMQSLETHLVHCEARGPVQAEHEPWHGWQTRFSSA